MICPQCESEYRSGFTVCADCAVPLVQALGPEAEPTPDGELVRVFETADATLIPVVRSLLEGAGMEVLVKGESVLDLFALGRLGGLNVVGPAEFFVSPNDAEAARLLLSDFTDAGGEQPPAE